MAGDQSVNDENPSMLDTIRTIFDSQLAEMNFCMPGEIVSYDASTQKANVQPLLKRRFRDGDIVELPQITGVPVAMPRAGKAFLSLPLKKGDVVMLVFSQRSLDTWKNSGGCVDPGTEPRKFNLSDAYAIPGGYPFNNPAPGDPNDVLLINDQSIFRLKTGGKFEMQKKSGDGVIDLILQYMEINNTATTNTIFGPLTKNENAQLTAITNKLKKLKA